MWVHDSEGFRAHGLGPEVERLLVDWASKVRLPTRMLVSSLAGISRSVEVGTSCFWEGRTRLVVARTGRSANRHRNPQAPCLETDFDPWKVDPATLPEITARVIECAACRGKGKTSCPRCLTSGHFQCFECGGEGQRWALRGAPRMVKCPSCRGKGILRCPCHDGLVSCVACEGQGQLDHWLEIEEKSFREERRAGMGELAALAARKSAPAETSWALEYCGDLARAPPAVRDLVGTSPLLRDIDPSCERLDKVEVHTLMGVATSISYRLFGRQGKISVRPWLSPAVVADTAPLEFRGLRLQLASFLGLIAGTLVTFGFALRGDYYAASPALFAFVLLIGVSAWAVRSATDALALPPTSRSHLVAAFAPILLVAFAHVSLAHWSRPTLGHAEEAARAGQNVAALRELQALAQFAASAELAANRHDQLQLELLLLDPDRKKALSNVSKVRFITADGSSRARAALLQKTLEEGEDLLQLGDWVQARARIDVFPEDLRNSEPVIELSWQLRAMELNALWASLRESTAPAADLFPQCSILLKKLTAAVVAPGGVSLGPLEVDVRLHCAKLEKSLERERRKIAEKARLRIEAEERAARRAKRQAQAAQSDWDSAPLLCRDGSLSPTCTCGRSSRRGCCSHHGGVAGCSEP